MVAPIVEFQLNYKPQWSHKAEATSLATGAKAMSHDGATIGLGLALP